MSKVSEKIAYIKGLAQGLDLKGDTPEQKLLLEILEALQAISEGMDELGERLDENDEAIESIDEALSDVEEILYDDEDEDDEECGCADCQEENGMDFIEYVCPHCGNHLFYDPEAFDLKEKHLCPECHKELFPSESGQ